MNTLMGRCAGPPYGGFGLLRAFKKSRFPRACHRAGDEARMGILRDTIKNEWFIGFRKGAEYISFEVILIPASISGKKPPLRAGAEVEHALFVEYLYAACSSENSGYAIG